MSLFLLRSRIGSDRIFGRPGVRIPSLRETGQTDAAFGGFGRHMPLSEYETCSVDLRSMRIAPYGMGQLPSAAVRAETAANAVAARKMAELFIVVDGVGEKTLLEYSMVSEVLKV